MSSRRATHFDQDGNEMAEKPDEREYKVIRACSAEIYVGGDLLDLFARGVPSHKESGPKVWWAKR